ncbi:MAG: lipopolysaccharide biosynthesis protein [Myxococcales bacterium]|nr:lipopolysaccharide biosynthesis protein [Myxococcales bacterium]
MARALGPAAVGLMAACSAVAAIVFQFVELRLHEAVIKYSMEYAAEKNARACHGVARVSLLLDAGTGVLATLVSLAAGWVVQERIVASEPSMADLYWPIFLLSAATTAFGRVGMATALGLMRVYDGFRLHALVVAVSAILRLSAMWAALVLGFGIMGVSIAGAVVALGTTAVLVPLSFRRLERRFPGERGGWEELRPRAREMRRFVRSTYLISVTQIPTKELDVALLPQLTSLEVVGAYKIAKNFMAAVWVLADPLFNTVYPEFTRMLAEKRPASARRFALRLTAVFGVVGLTGSLFAALVVPPLIHGVLGDRFAVATPLFLLMLLGAAPWLAAFWAHPFIIAAGRPDLSLRAMLVSSAFMFVGLLVATPLWGGMGAAAVSGLSSFAGVATVLLFARTSGVFPRADAVDAPQPEAEATA